MNEQKNIGALWEKTNDFGKYMIGNVEIEGKKYPIICYINEFKSSPVKPDWIIELAKENQNDS